MPLPLPPPFLEPHQSRSEPPTGWEDRLAEAIEAAFAAGHWDLPGLVEFVQARGVDDREGRPWTTETFQRQLDELGH